MAINPMQRKAQNSFLLGILVTLLITGLIIGFLVLQLTKLTKAQKEAEAALKTVYVVKQDIESGESVTTDKLEQKNNGYGSYSIKCFESNRLGKND